MNEKASSLLQLLNQTDRARSLLQEHYGSVLEIASGSLQQLMDTDRRLHISEARAIHEQARAISAVTVRQFREQRLTTSIRRAFEPGSGIRGLVDAPTYNDLFRPDWANHCPTDAIEATTSPVAYLADLYREVQKIEQSGGPGGGQENRILLADRRPDLADLWLDHSALDRVEPTLVLVNEILETSARRYLDSFSDERPLDDVLLEVRYPATLPYERYQQQINYTLRRKDRLPGDAIRCTDPAYPYFKEPGVHSLLSDVALVQDTGFGPIQQGILLEAPYFPEFDPEQDPEQTSALPRINPRTHRLEPSNTDPTEFFKTHFGESDVFKLLDTQTFCLRTGLKTEELESLLSVGAYASYRSANFISSDTAPMDGAAFGSVYVNAGVSPAMAIETTRVADSGPSHQIVNWSPDRFDRLNRMVRLARWLELPFDQVDRLLMASIGTEGKSSDHRITTDTLRALGLFQGLRMRYKVSADDFAALLQGLAVHGRGKQPTQFDQIFNSQALFPGPLVLDGEVFNITPGNEAERQKIDHLCAALGMTFEMYRFTAKVIEQSYAGEPLHWDTAVVSAFYRLVRLPHYLGLTTIEALALLELLDNGGSHLVSKLAGPPHIATYQTSDNTDTLSAIHALVEASAWLAEHKWTVGQACRIVLPALTKPVASEAELNLLKQMHSRLAAALISDSSFAEIGAAQTRTVVNIDDHGVEVLTSVDIDWFHELKEFIETGETLPAAKGLVKYLRGETEERFEAALSGIVEEVLGRLDLPVEGQHAQICNMIMRARGAQEALLMEGLAGYLDSSVDLVKVLLFWAEGNRYQVLMEVLRVFGNASGLLQVPVGDDVLLVLDNLVKRATITQHLDLSPAFVDQCVQHPQWFGLDHTGLSLQTLYFFSQYASMVRLSAQPEERLLDYMRLINSLWDTALEGDKRLIRDSAANKLAGFLDWGVRQVLALASHLNPEDGVIFTLAELDLLVRTCLLARHTGLDADALLALGSLTPTSDTSDFRHAAELALASLTEAVPGTPVGEVGQSHSSVITVTPDYLVANKPGESATYSITLRDFMDEPFEGVTISWSSNLGELEGGWDPTDDKGQATVTLNSGDTMGIAHVVAEYGLGDKVLAPVITIGHDDASLHFSEPFHDRTQALSNKLEAINFSVTLVDDFTNLGIDRLVDWGTTLGEFQRYQTMTNHEGISQSILRSGPLGMAKVVAHYENGSRWTFPEVEFTSTPYFQYVRFINTVVEGIEGRLVCRLTELNGDPVPVGTVVHWSADIEGLLDVQSLTESDGLAYARYEFASPGEVVVTVSADDNVRDKASAVTTIHARAVIARHEASDTHYMLGSPDAVVFAVWLTAGGSAFAKGEIDWAVNDVFKAKTLSDNEGMATFSSKFIAADDVSSGCKVSATVAGTDMKVEFAVSIVPYFVVEVSLRGDDIYDRAPDFLSRFSNYIIHVDVTDGAGVPIVGVPLKLKNLGVGLDILRVSIENLDKVVYSTSEGIDFPVSLPGSSSHYIYLGELSLSLDIGRRSTWKGKYRVGLIYWVGTFLVRNNKLQASYQVRSDGLLLFNDNFLGLADVDIVGAIAETGWQASGKLNNENHSWDLEFLLDEASPTPLPGQEIKVSQFAVAGENVIFAESTAQIRH
ncbi:Tc toxin subunit A [Pseudomonas citrulli]|uniref:Tc toxin subunit A n=1 Tax=Pseudomonas citrulli TaxID=3064347 RepID=A0ABT9C7B4_9PSED|nr:Tc toxin subunit A [Pseudomonas sp. K18]MDO7899428.1 Tc toxin subunit A [Pseudomonas sp. K18]